MYRLFALPRHSFPILFLTLALGAAIGRADEPPSAGGIGQHVPEFTLADFRGREWSWDELAGSREDQPRPSYMVVAFLGTECPLVNLYADRLVALAKKYEPRGVRFVGVNSNQQDSVTELAHFARVHELEFPLLKDVGNQLADAFGAERTPEIYVLDADRRVLYRGRIDDQYTYGIQRPQVEHQYLVEALDALLAGKSVPTARTEVVGCHIGRILTPSADSEVTYHGQVRSILQKNCVQCHRPGEIAPFSLTDYDETVGWAEMIAEVVHEQRMPPWHADPRHGKFVNDMRLTEAEKQTLYDWVDAGAPEGTPSPVAEPIEELVTESDASDSGSEEAWRIGKPDRVIRMADKPFVVPAIGEVKYQYFEVDPGFTEDTWVQAAECRPGNRAVVHHIIVGIRPPGDTHRRFHGDARSVWLAATAPGARPLQLPAGHAKLIPAHSKLVFQLHYTPIGKEQTDLSSVGLVFADPKEVRRRVLTQQAGARRFKIPPHAANHEVTSRYTFRKDARLLSMFPHMHLRGKSFRYEAEYPDGTREVLLDVPRYDFNWQNTYELVEPKRMPAGTVLHCTAHFDNSEQNLANPDPTVAVGWGDQTWDEMMIGYFDMVLEDEKIQADYPRDRARQFEARVAEGREPTWSDELGEAAQSAGRSTEAFVRFALQLKQQVPQLDRVCWTSVDGDRLRVERVAQQERFEKLVGGEGVAVEARNTGLAAAAGETAPVTYAQLEDARWPDLRFMERGFSSSVHIPITLADRPGTINFWSAEPNAFGPQAAAFLERAARSVAAQAPTK